MKKILTAAIAALTIAGLSSGAFAAPTVVVKTGPKAPVKVVVVKHPPHWGFHQVCKTTWIHHKKHTVCVWVKNK
jgi:hypothetical protein